MSFGCGDVGPIGDHVGPTGSQGPLWPGTPSKREWKLFSGTLSLKNDLKNIKNAKKIRKKILYIFVVESLQDFFSRANFDYFPFSRKVMFL